MWRVNSLVVLLFSLDNSEPKLLVELQCIVVADLHMAGEEEIGGRGKG